MTCTSSKTAPGLDIEAIYSQEANVTANDTSQELASESDVDRRTFSMCTFSRVKSSTSIHKLIAQL